MNDTFPPVKVYLASPYSHPSQTVMECRYRSAVVAAGDLMKRGYIVFAPIAHSHAIGLSIDTSTDHDFWLKQDMPWLESADVLMVLCLQGWAESRGVRMEIDRAREIGMRIEYLDLLDAGLVPSIRHMPEPDRVRPLVNEAPTPRQVEGWAESYVNERTLLDEQAKNQIMRNLVDQDEKKDTNPKDSIGIRKAPMSTVPANVLLEVGVAMLEGASKYGRHNYRAMGVRNSVYYDATMRHLMAWWEGEDTDQGSGLSHITKAIASLVVLRDAMMQGMNADDRPYRSASFLPVLNQRALEIIDKYIDANPHHFTLMDM